MGKKILVFFLSFSMLALCACAPISGESSAESSAPESSAPESSAPESSVSESSAPESSASESSAPEDLPPEERTPVSSVDVQAEEYCNKYIMLWCLNCPFLYDYDYRDPSAPKEPEALFVSWLFDNCWYLSHGDSPTSDGAQFVYPAEKVESTIAEFFPFPPELLREKAVADGYKQYFKGEYHLRGGFGGRPPYPVVSDYSQDDGLLRLACEMYSVDTDELLLAFTLWIEERPDGGWRYMANRVDFMSEHYNTAYMGY